MSFKATVIVCVIKRLVFQTFSFLFRLWKVAPQVLVTKSSNLHEKSQSSISALKKEFMESYGESYGYSGRIDELRNKEFKRLSGVVYLDHAGATLYSESQMQYIIEDFNSNVYGNPHSQSESSVTSSNVISSARQQVLAYCNASSKEYTCVFTSGATAALKLVGEFFPWSRDSCYLYTMENHNSVLGIREYALNQGAMAMGVDITNMDYSDGTLFEGGSAGVNIMNIHKRQRRVRKQPTEKAEHGETYHLFSFPSECNFSGMRFDLELVNVIKSGKFIHKSLPHSDFRGKWMVLLDAAKGCGTQPPDLSKFPADFVVISFYKIFGYPTGLGALIVRSDAAKCLQKSYFSGGTVAASIADIDFVKHRDSLVQKFEDGTQSFLNIASLKHGFNVIEQLGIVNIGCHTGSLAAFTSQKLRSLRHYNQVKVCVIYGSQKYQASCGSLCKQGPVITFNLKRPDGSWVGYREVEKLASTRGIQLRTGCFCNPGACAKFLELSHEDLQINFESGHVCWDDIDIISGKPTGAVRVSFGYMSTFEDAEVLINFIEDFFVSKSPMMSSIQQNAYCQPPNKSQCFLESIRVYPIKSCSGFSVESWSLGETGLLYDREWLLKSSCGEVLTQKRIPSMCTIKTFIDRQKGKLFVTSPYVKEHLEISLQETPCELDKEAIQLCGHRIEANVYGAEVNEWFTNALQYPCVLVRKHTGKYRSCRRANWGGCPKDGTEGNLSFVNEGQLLLVSKGSIQDLSSRIISRRCAEETGERSMKSMHEETEMERFRPNLLVSGADPYEEDQWQSVTIGEHRFRVLGGCNRCEMINIDPKTGLRSKAEPLSTLASYRRQKGKINFGILLNQETRSNTGLTKSDEEDLILTMGSQVICE